ncbi:HAUS augmin-like complex subunit 6 [Elysia marginata]|uniref:HAUS augmin-like complex subunit 6 n=1 Tax=Elysia marginata TaxID=1093978 RepID=A0AAV4EWU1_9GAST|nr:HAUS augmin-like complex subunit 6 [Elysia marginata]
MDVEAMNTVLFTNLQLLGMDIIAMEGKYHIPFSKDMFNLPNKAGSEAVLHFLFDRLNPSLFKEQFRDCWPVVDRKAEMQFRKVCNTWLSSIQADNPDAHLPRINASLLLSPGGRKFIHLLYKFSSYVLTQAMTKEHGYDMREDLTYPLLNRSSFGDIMSTALEDSCLQLHASCFEQLHLTVAANRKWRESGDELVKTYRRLSRSKRDHENEKRQLVNTLAENAQKQGLSLPAKRTVSMFDSGEDIYSRHRGKRMEKARSKWDEVHKFSEDMRDKRNILKGVILVDFLSRGETVNSDSYIDTLKRLWARIVRVRSDMDIGNVLLLHHNALPHTSVITRETIASFGWIILPHPSYSPDLAHSDYHLFGSMKQGLRCKHYENDLEV